MINWDEQSLGEMSDASLAKRLGVSSFTVGYHRNKRGIAACSREEPVWYEHLLGKMPDTSLAKIVGTSLWAVKYRRQRKGISGYRVGSEINWDEQPLGKVSDRALARKLKLSCDTVRCRRVERGIPAIEVCENLKGQRFGKLTVVDRCPRKLKARAARWLCKCDCGQLVEVQAPNLKNGNSRSCGCSKPRKHRRNIDLTGKRFGKLVVLELWPIKNKEGTKKWLCECDCGELSVVRGTLLRRGATKSCGCLKRKSEGS